MPSKKITVQSDVPYAGHERNIRIANGDVELIVPTEYGPRVLRYARVGGRNVFGELSAADQGNDTPFGDKWHIYGGHRLWYAPEGATRSYWPDNAAVRVDLRDDGLTLTQPIEGHTRLEKSIDVRLDPRGSRVSVVHRLVNHGAFEVELAPWALSVMAQGGRAIFPHADFVPHPDALAPARPLVLWPFTRMNDPRWTWGDRFLCLRQDRERKTPQKVGFYDDHGWMAYAVGDDVFIKRHHPAPGPHADLGCNVETFTNEAILELETLGPLTRLAPMGSVEHREEWFLFEAALGAAASEEEITATLTPLLATAR